MTLPWKRRQHQSTGKVLDRDLIRSLKDNRKANSGTDDQTQPGFTIENWISFIIVEVPFSKAFCLEVETSSLFDLEPVLHTINVQIHSDPIVISLVVS